MAASSLRLDQWLVCMAARRHATVRAGSSRAGRCGYVASLVASHRARFLTQSEIRGEGLLYVGRVGSNSNECCKPLASMSWPGGLDIGASTGGFVDCLLQRDGAAGLCPRCRG